MPTPAQIPGLEARLARDSSDFATALALGEAYRAAKRLDDAARVLGRAHAERPEDPDGILQLALTEDDLDHYQNALQLYRAYLELGGSATLKESVERRLPLVEHEAMWAAARAQLAEEKALSSTPPDPRAVAVFPFVVSAGDTILEPLGRALAEFLITDLGQVSRLRVLDRVKVQALLDEMNLANAGLVDPATAARSGRLLRAGRVVEGQLTGDPKSLTMSASLVSAIEGALSGKGVQESTGMGGLLNAEKQLAIRLCGEMGVQLTPAERQRILRRPTPNAAALLAYGRGLEALDAGNFTAAASHFDAAVHLDPRFGEAQIRARAATAAASAASTTQIAQTASQQSATTAASASIAIPLTRDAAAEALGTEGLGRNTTLTVILHRPEGH